MGVDLWLEGRKFLQGTVYSFGLSCLGSCVCKQSEGALEERLPVVGGGLKSLLMNIGCV